jgi:hypothetical protein
MRHRWIVRVIVLVSTLAGPGLLAAAERSPSGTAGDRVEPVVLQQLDRAGRADFFVEMADTADLTRAASLGSKEAKGRFVLAALQRTAASSQHELRGLLDRRGVTYKPFYITNAVLVRGGTHSLVREIAGLSGVARISANHESRAADVDPSSSPPGESRAVEPNLVFVGAPDVWAMGITGAGIVVAVDDTGLDEDHPAIAAHYRGCLNPPACTSEDHNYNWWDATGTYPYDPWDGHGHGTFCTGIAIGDDGGANQIGMAPGAKTIHCKAMDDGGSGNDAMFLECFQWNLAPWNLAGVNPDPAAAPDVVNISWGYWGGGNDLFRDVIDALQASGIVVFVAAGNEGPGCSTLRSPGDYKQVLTVGSVDPTTTYPGELSYFSSRGPSILDPSPPDYFPDVMAPGEYIRSSVPGGVYQGGWSGTPMAAAHVTGLVALMWSACPEMRGEVPATMSLIQNAASPLTGQPGSCGGDYTVGPNNDWGYGTIDAFTSVLLAFYWCDGGIFADGFESGGTSAWSATVP